MSEREKIELDREDGARLIEDGECGPYRVLPGEHEITGRRRWSILRVALVKDTSANSEDQTMYLLRYSEGATESQDEGLFEFMKPVLIPAKLVMVEKWVEE